MREDDATTAAAAGAAAAVGTPGDMWKMSSPLTPLAVEEAGALDK